MRARLRVCTEPGCGEMQRGPRCRTHQSARDRFQRRTTPTKINQDRDRERRRAAVTAHRDRHGDWCPGFEREPHRATDLTADHRHEQQAGGAWDGDLDVLCRSCNSRKAKRTQDAIKSNARSMARAHGGGGYPRRRQGGPAAGEGSERRGGFKTPGAGR